MLDKFEGWTERKVTIFELPSYSPQLKGIEILCDLLSMNGWIGIDAYSS